MPKVSAAPTQQAAAVAPVGVMAPATTAAGLPPGAPPPRLATANPDMFLNTGLASNFNGRVVSCWLLPRKYKTGKKENTYSLSFEITIQADDHSLGNNGLVTEYLKVDNLSHWVPSRVDPQWDAAGQKWIYTPAGGDINLYMKLHAGEAGFPTPTPGETALLPPDEWRGWYAVPGAQNSRDGFMKQTKFEQFTTQLKVAGYHTKAPHINWGDMRQFLVGVYGYWVRLPYEFKGGNPPEGAQKQDTLCLAEILDLGPISGAGGPVAAPVSAMTIPAPATFTPTPSPAPAPVLSMPAGPPPGVVTGATIPAPMAPPAGLGGADDPLAISHATNEILTQLVAGKPEGVNKAAAGTAVFEGVNARGLQGAKALLLLNDPVWIVDDLRTFGYVPERGQLVPLS